MREFARIAALAAAAMGVSSVYNIERPSDPLRDTQLDFYPRERRGKGQNNRRGKGKRSPPKSRPNRLVISKRVRRKHRRAAQ